LLQAWRIQAGDGEQATMNKRRVKRAVLLTGTVALLIAVVVFRLSLRSYRRQENLNRQLIAALMKQDPKQALALVNAGADPNTPVKPPSPPTLTQLWNHLIHRTALPVNDTPSAFVLVCGGYVFDNDTLLPCLNSDEPHVVETMLQHGAQKNVKDGGGWTPFFWSVLGEHPQTVDVLLKHGVDVNAQDKNGYTALYWIILTSATVNPPERSKSVNIVRQLLTHGADPNLTGMSGVTPLQLAQVGNRPDLMALLKQAGAKK
jgi:hypothetical protein